MAFAEDHDVLHPGLVMFYSERVCVCPAHRSLNIPESFSVTSTRPHAMHVLNHPPLIHAVLARPLTHFHTHTRPAVGSSALREGVREVVEGTRPGFWSSLLWLQTSSSCGPNIIRNTIMHFSSLESLHPPQCLAVGFHPSRSMSPRLPALVRCEQSPHVLSSAVFHAGVPPRSRPWSGPVVSH